MRRLGRLLSVLSVTLAAAGCSGGGGGSASTGTGTDTDMGSTSSSSASATTTGSGTTTNPSTTDATDSGTTTGSTTGPACPDAPTDGDYGECNDVMWMCMGGGFCLQSNTPGEFGVCSRGCNNDCQCWVKPSTGTANPKCDLDLGAGNNGVCVLDCASDRTCPDGMYCDAGYSICVFADSSGGTSTSTSTSTTG